jgi:hypothetical protein
LHVTQRSPLFNRSLRNHYEHYEERLQDWADHTQRGVPLDGILVRDDDPLKGAEMTLYSIGTSHRIGPMKGRSRRSLRILHYPPPVATFNHWRYPLDPLRDELRRVREAAQTETMKMLFPDLNQQ